MNYRVLIVEDETFLQLALKDNLESNGFTVEVADDGEKAIEAVHRKKPDIVLLDILLQKKDGFAVLSAIKEDQDLRSVPVVVLSNLGEDTNIKRAFDLGADEYFVKSQHPIQEVMDIIKEYQEGKRSVKQPK